MTDIKTEEKPEMIGTPEARALIEAQGPGPVSLPTVITWCKQYHLGVKIGGRWYLYKDRLVKFLNEGGKIKDAAKKTQA